MPAVRTKTTASIVEKLKRESIRLSRLQDVAGCRIVVTGVAEQDRVARLVADALPNSTLIDRREKHSHGYRAIHIVADHNGRPVEIQIRTELQHLWAVWSETLAGALDQSIKYGGGSMQIHENLATYSQLVASLEIQSQKVAADLKSLSHFAPSALKVLPLEALTASRLIGGMQELLVIEQVLKDRLVREILKVNSER